LCSIVWEVGCSFCWNRWLSLVNLTFIFAYRWQSLNVYLMGPPSVVFGFKLMNYNILFYAKCTIDWYW
jgi:hypothetical protein